MVSAILLAGGKGKRMGNDVPKQFLSLGAGPMALYSFEVLCDHKDIDEVIVVCQEKYRRAFCHPKVSFALPGKRRQDSVFSGLKAAHADSDYVLVHDAARPFITPGLVAEVMAAAKEVGAAAAGVPLKFTIKEVDASGIVLKTPDRSRFFEIQTPQAMRTDLLREGFELAIRDGLTVTDDASLIELLKKPVKIVGGSYMNMKITTKEDLNLAKSYAEAN